MHVEIKIAQFEKRKRARSVQSYPAEEGGNIFWLIQLYLKESPIVLALPSIARYRTVEFVEHQHSHRKHFFNLRNLRLGCGCGRSGLHLNN